MKKINRNTIFISLGTLVIGILIGWLVFGTKSKQTLVQQHQHEQNENQVWTCSMHPQIRKSEPGKCPICGMELIPLNNESISDDNPMEVKMSPTALKLANIQTSIITRQNPVKEIRMNGKVKADERNVFSQSSHLPGRIEKLMVNFTGESVRKGQVLAYIYSPDLVTAQEELFEAYKIRESQPGLYQAARGKLLNWKLTENQVDNIIKAGKLQDQFPVLSDVSGIVLNKRINLGDYIQKGQSLFEVADLSKVWVLFEVYENDMRWINKGDEVVFTIQSMPGAIFKSKISFVDPVINPQTRVATARVEINSRGNKFKPELFAEGIVKSPVGINKKELIVPKSAVMWTGERSVVYIKIESPSGISFMMREIVLGPALADGYIVKSGLKEGEELATNGTFSIDAAAQLAGKPSMMNPEGGVAMTGHNHGTKQNATPSAAQAKPGAIKKKAGDEIFPLFTEYFLLKDALVADDFNKSKQIAPSLLNKLNKVKMQSFSGEEHNVWMKLSPEIATALNQINSAKNIEEVRTPFKMLSDRFVILAKTFGPFNEPFYIQHCPMANNNKGADWVSRDKEIRNPYFGKKMLTCGETIKTVF